MHSVAIHVFPPYRKYSLLSLVILVRTPSQFFFSPSRHPPPTIGDPSPPAWACIGDPYNALEGAKKYLQLQLRMLTGEEAGAAQKLCCGGQ